jgi:hypothetical protein
MKKSLVVAGLVSLAVSMALLAGPVRDWHDLHAVHEKIQSAIKDMERARAANHYDMAGHGAKAEELLHQAEHELHEAEEAAKAGK